MEYDFNKLVVVLTINFCLIIALLFYVLMNLRRYLRLCLLKFQDANNRNLVSLIEQEEQTRKLVLEAVDYLTDRHGELFNIVDDVLIDVRKEKSEYIANLKAVKKLLKYKKYIRETDLPVNYNSIKRN